MSSCGTISWRDRARYLSEGLAGEDIGLEEVDDAIWIIYFIQTRLARFDERTRTLLAINQP